MAFLINQIKDQKILEMEVAVDQFIEENSISENAMIHTMIFDKSVFETEEEVREYIKDKYMYASSISDGGDNYTATFIAPSQIDEDTEVTVELRRGVTAIAADLMPIPTMEEITFNDKGEMNLSTKFGTIDLKDGLPQIIEIARVAEGEHPAYGKLRITQEHLESMESNFKSKVTGVDLAVNEDHKKNEAFGWFRDVWLSFDKQTLYGQIQWNGKGYAALSEKQYRYFSPEFRFNYIHPHSGEEHGPTLLGGALTNYPFLKMEAITELNNKKNSQGEKKVKKEETIDLSVHNAQIVELNGKITEIQGKLDASEEKLIELSNENKDLKEAAEKVKREAAHQKLFTDNKINKAQLVALNEGKTMLEVLSLSEKMNSEATGGDANTNTEEIQLSEAEKKVAKQLGLTDEEFIAGNKEA